MPCKEQDRLLRDLRSAVDEHADLVEKIVLLIRSGQRGEDFDALVIRAAHAKSKWEWVQERLKNHRAVHGC